MDFYYKPLPNWEYLGISKVILGKSQYFLGSQGLFGRGYPPDEEVDFKKNNHPPKSSLICYYITLLLNVAETSYDIPI